MQTEPKNIVLCCDGTGNEFGTANSNVVKLYTCLIVDKKQVAYYHPGVGTMAAQNRSTQLGRLESKITGLAFGAGFTDAISDAYRFLMQEYRDGDRIFLFGFSRGAYAVRALAGALGLYGLLCPGNDGHLPYLMRMYSAASRNAYDQNKKHIEGDDLSAAFKATFSREVAVHFVGIWDTVSSVGWVYDPVKLLFDGRNPIVRKGRHAVSVDEHRCFFQDNLWGLPLPPSETPLLTEQQDIVQVWFPGVHSDVGGGYEQEECAPAEAALRWILDEAAADGLVLNIAKKAAVLGEAPGGPQALTKIFPRPKTAMSLLHNSLTAAWMILEIFPHKYFDIEGKKRWQWIPWLHRREIPGGSLLHPNLIRYLDEYPGYKPKNLNRSKAVLMRDSPVGAPDLPIPSVAAKLEAEGFYVYRR